LVSTNQIKLSAHFPRQSETFGKSRFEFEKAKGRKNQPAVSKQSPDFVLAPDFGTSLVAVPYLFCTFLQYCHLVVNN
jgi:hypothetical protein